MRLTPTAPDLHPAPLDRGARFEELRETLRAHGIMVSRMSHAAQTGLTVTYLYTSEAADATRAAYLIIETLAWADTVVDALPGGAVAVTTSRG